MAPHSGLPDPPTPSPATCSLILSPDPKTEFFKGSQSSKTLACSILCHCMVLHLHFTLSGHRNRQSGVFSSHSVSLPLRCPTPSRLDQLFKHLNRAGPHLPVNWGMNTFTAAPSSTQLLNWKKKNLPGSTGLRSLRTTCDWRRRKAGFTQRPCWLAEYILRMRTWAPGTGSLKGEHGAPGTGSLKGKPVKSLEGVFRQWEWATDFRTNVFYFLGL